MDVNPLFASCTAGSFARIFQSICELFAPAPRVDLDRYQVTVGRKLGEGGAADVFLATTDASAPGGVQQFALKRVHCNGPVGLEGTLAECQLMARQLHPCIMQLKEQKTTQQPREQSSVVYMLMPLYRGGSLWDLVHARHARGQPLTDREIGSIMGQMADALAALHEAGWVHRDFKPQNVLLQAPQAAQPASLAAAADGAPQEPEHEAVLTDLGSCCSLQSLHIGGLPDAIKVTAEAETKCSPLYRPPELYNTPHGCQLDGRIDVWALGCTLYFMLLGVNPFEKQCAAGASLVLAVYKAQIDWDGAPSGMSLHWKELVHRCLKPDWKDRPTCAEIGKWLSDHAAAA